MTDSRKKNGFVAVANEIWDEVIRRDFSKRQKDILLFIWRLSYGCNQPTAIIPMQKDFALCGVGAGHIGAELRQLEKTNVIHRMNNEYSFNENHEQWDISSNKGWDKSRYGDLVHINLTQAKNERSKVTETVTEGEEKLPDESYRNSNSELPKQEVEEGNSDYRNSNFDVSSQLPKQEVKVTETVIPEEEMLEENAELTETVTSEVDELPNQEVEVTETVSDGKSRVTETVTSTPHEPLQDAASELSKDSKDLKDLKELKHMCVSLFETFWKAYPRKLRKKESLNVWEKLLKNNVDPKYLIRCAMNYAAHCKANGLEDRYILHATTFLNPKNEKYADYEEALVVHKPDHPRQGAKLEQRELTAEENEFYDRIYASRRSKER
ncbi:replication protein [Paenibacillus provencensis]|uniref:Replication protein n=2 Tax=Bacteria TaxID=2 RepID=A0ABW3PMU8_9BACL|nr:replication protein [Paenibacillus sp. MER 78]MCM3128991.1 replication protein [Paenibacillus sp. MER 78]